MILVYEMTEVLPILFWLVIHWRDSDYDDSDHSLIWYGTLVITLFVPLLLFILFILGIPCYITDVWYSGNDDDTFDDRI
jgi:hypothetical protein